MSKVADYITPAARAITTSREVILVEENKLHQENTIVVKDIDEEPEEISLCQDILRDTKWMIIC